MSATTRELDRLMTVRQVSEKMNTGMAFIYQAISSGRLQCYQFGPIRGRIRISERQLADFLESSQKEKPKAPLVSLSVEAPPSSYEMSSQLNKLFKR